MEQELLDARAKLEAKFGKSTQLGGKGTQRRIKKVQSAKPETSGEDKKLKAAIKKFGVQPLGEIEEVNMFKDDNTIIHFKRPQVQFSVRENLLVVTGPSESKEFKDLMPEILRQVGPQQYEFLKDLIGKEAPGAKAEAGEDDEDDVPPLVEGTFDNAGAAKEEPKESPRKLLHSKRVERSKRRKNELHEIDRDSCGLVIGRSPHYPLDTCPHSAGSRILLSILSVN